jgi:hypothetical protein
LMVPLLNTKRTLISVSEGMSVPGAFVSSSYAIEEL